MFLAGASLVRAQSVPPSPQPSPQVTPTRTLSSFTIPKGWVRAQGDTVAMEWHAPTGRQSLRLARTGRTPQFIGPQGVETVKAMINQFNFPQSMVYQTTVCNGTQPAVSAMARNRDGMIMMEMVIVEGSIGGAIVTYGIPDGSTPDPAAENALRSICLQ